MGRQDHKIEKLVIPPNTAFDVIDGGVSVEFDGDVVLSGPMRNRLGRIVSNEGSITLLGPLEVGEVIARHGSIVADGAVRAQSLLAMAGPITVSGDVQAEEIRSPAGSVSIHGNLTSGAVHAAEELIVEGDISARLLQGGFVRINSGSVNVKGIEGTVRVELGEAKLAVEVVIAPEVQVSAHSSGRVNVIESVNELVPNSLKGGFRLHEYAEFTGVDPARFLEERGVRPLSELSSPSVVVRGVPMSAADDRTLGGDLEEDELSELDLEPVEPVGQAGQVVDDSPPPIHFEPPHAPEPAPPTLELDAKLQTELSIIANRVRGAYANASEPQPVVQLLALIDARDYLGVKENLTALWNQLVPWYQQQGKLIPYAVISSFNAINTMMRRL